MCVCVCVRLYIMCMAIFIYTCIYMWYIYTDLGNIYIIFSIGEDYFKYIVEMNLNTFLVINYILNIFKVLNQFFIILINFTHYIMSE